jgi:hypothetical protein
MYRSTDRPDSTSSLRFGSVELIGSCLRAHNDTSEIATSGIAWFDWHGEANGLRINEIGAILTHRAVTAAKIIGVAIVIVVAAELHDSNTGLNRAGSV